jgi:bisphosphoglycerate-dependent phosphoglycerate mutase
LLMLLSVSTGCVSKKAISEEFADCLIQMNAETIDNVAKRLEIIDQNLYATEESLLKLEQVMVPAQGWIENQKVELLEEHNYGSWRSRVTPQSLAEFKNDQYEITALELAVYRIGTQNQSFRTVIKVTDLATKTQSDWETIESELKGRKSTLEQQRQAKLENAQLSTSTLLSVLEHSEDWEIKKIKIENINSPTYRISGPGLGMAGKFTSGNMELASGSWIYYRDSKTIMPDDAQSAALKNIL